MLSNRYRVRTLSNMPLRSCQYQHNSNALLPDDLKEMWPGVATAELLPVLPRLRTASAAGIWLECAPGPLLVGQYREPPRDTKVPQANRDVVPLLAVLCSSAGGIGHGRRHRVGRRNIRICSWNYSGISVGSSVKCSESLSAGLCLITEHMCLVHKDWSFHRFHIFSCPIKDECTLSLISRPRCRWAASPPHQVQDPP